jgi:hypothetical protein
MASFGNNSPASDADMRSTSELEEKFNDFDFDRLERGDAKDMLSNKCLLPTPVGRRIVAGSYTSQHKPVSANTSAFRGNSKSQETHTEWHRCFIERSAKNKFRMYDESSGSMLLSATKTKEGDFLISQYDAFPDEHESGASSKSITGAMASMFGSTRETSTGTGGNECLTSGLGKYGYVCTLRLNSSRTGYKLYRNGCELCDNVLQKYSCTGCSNGQQVALPQRQKSSDGEKASNQSRTNHAPGFSAHGDDANRTAANIREDRQLLAVIGQSMQEIEHTGVMARYTTMDIPAFLKSNAHVQATQEDQSNNNNSNAAAVAPQRIVWCPRTLATAEHGKGPAHLHATLLGREELSASEALNSGGRGRRTSSLFADAAVPEKERLRFACRLPSWSDEVGSLVLTFFGGRVLQPSAKNFMMEDKSAVDLARKTNSSGPGVKDATNVMFQFGKVNKGKFNLDFKHPMSPIQSFALALSSFGFTCKD